MRHRHITSLTVAAVLAGCALPAHALADAPTTLDPDVPQPAAAASAPRVQSALSATAPFVDAEIATDRQSGALDDGIFAAIRAYAGSDRVDFGPIETLLGDDSVVDLYASGGADGDCTTPGYTANVSVPNLAKVVEVRDALGVAQDLRDGCDAAAQLITALRDPSTRDNGPVAFGEIIRVALGDGIHVPSQTVDDFADDVAASSLSADQEAQVLRDLIAARDAGYGGLGGEVSAAVADLTAAQNPDGSFGDSPSHRTTDTGSLAAQALAAAGDTGAAQSAAAWITRVQFDDTDAPSPDYSGLVALSYPDLYTVATDPTDYPPDSLLTTTLLAVPGLVAGAYPSATSPPPSTTTTVGTPGPTGAAGPTGPQGPAGATGPRGPAGASTTTATPGSALRVHVARQRRTRLARSGALTVAIRLRSGDTATVTLTIGRAAARRLGLRPRGTTTALATAHARGPRSGRTTVRLRLPARLRAALRAHRGATTLAVVATSGGPGHRTVRRTTVTVAG